MQHGNNATLEKDKNIYVLPFARSTYCRERETKVFRDVLDEQKVLILRTVFDEKKIKAVLGSPDYKRLKADLGISLHTSSSGLVSSCSSSGSSST